MNKRYYKIADTYLVIESELDCYCVIFKDFEVVDMRSPFIDMDKKQVVNLQIVNKSIETGCEKESKCILSSDCVSVHESKQSYTLFYRSYEAVIGCVLKDLTAIVYLKNGSNTAEIVNVIRDVFFYYIHKMGKIAIHSASIVYEGKVWLFSASSGVGKSTHSSLWHENGFNFEDFNGDLAVCYCNENGEAVAASTPWCGTSGVFCNKIIRLGGIMFLKRGDTNRVNKLRSFEGSFRMAARCVSPAWTESQVEKTLEVIARIVGQIDMAEFICTPFKEAAQISKRYIDDLC